MKKQVTAADVGARIQEIRKAQVVSQETLAGLAGTGQRYKDGSTKRIRTQEEASVCAALGAKSTFDELPPPRFGLRLQGAM